MVNTPRGFLVCQITSQLTLRFVGADEHGIDGRCLSGEPANGWEPFGFSVPIAIRDAKFAGQKMWAMRSECSALLHSHITGPKALCKLAQGKRVSRAPPWVKYPNGHSPQRGMTTHLSCPVGAYALWGGVTQGGARYTRLPWAGFLSTFGAFRRHASSSEHALAPGGNSMTYTATRCLRQ